MAGSGSAVAAGLPDAVALESASAAWTYAELGTAAAALAARLHALPGGIDRPRVGHAFDLTPEAVVAIHAVARSDAVLAPAHPGWTDRQAERFTAAVRPAAMLVSPGRPWAGAWDRSSLSLPGFGPVDLLLPLERRSPEPMAPAGTDVLLTTSGSGGAPRTVCHAWSRLRANARLANDRSGASARDVQLATLAWAHVGGLGVVLRAAEIGSRIVCGPTGFDSPGVLSAIERRGVTGVSLVPVMLERLLDVADAPPLALTHVLIGGAAVPPRLLERAVSAGWPISLTYGLTEAGSQVATMRPETVAVGVEDRAPGRGLLESPLEGFDLRLEEDGELAVRGPSIMLGYLEEEPADPDGWHRTGDFATRDDQGGLVITGRRTNRLVSGGTNVDPEEVEAVLLEHPDIADVCVVGVPDERWGDLVMAVVVPGVASGEGESPVTRAYIGLTERLDGWIREHLDGPRRPRRWRIVDELPRTATGKIDRAAVRADTLDCEPQC
ncbi:MAG: acyl--CoA ligase [Gemmatimonadota bacterium]|nr:acyl--CoA ligase [Gemmatimonadota bacterium]